MNNPINKKLVELIGKMDEKMLKTKLNTALDMLKNGNTEQLAKKINKADKEELLDRIDEFDKSKLNEMNIDVEDIKKRITQADLDKLKLMIGEHGDEIIQKLKNLME